MGLQVVWGLQWDPSKHWHVGVVFRSPVFRLYEQTQAVTLSGSSSPNASPPTSNYSLGFQGNLGIEAKQLTPMRVHAGIAHDLSKGVVAFEGSLQAPYNGSSSKSPSIAVANIRAGLRGPITTTTWLGGGIFTDRTSVRRLAATGDTAIDYYGVSLGLEFGTPYRVLDDPPTGAPVRRLLMSTTLALSYALGVGDVANIGFTASNGGNQLFETTPLRQNVIAHEFVLHIGSTLAN